VILCWKSAIGMIQFKCKFIKLILIQKYFHKKIRKTEIYAVLRILL